MQLNQCWTAVAMATEIINTYSYLPTYTRLVSLPCSCYAHWGMDLLMRPVEMIGWYGVCTMSSIATVEIMGFVQAAPATATAKAKIMGVVRGFWSTPSKLDLRQQPTQIN